MAPTGSAAVRENDRHILKAREALSRGLLATSDSVNMKRLVGNPHLYGRVRQLRSGFIVEPIGVLTLQPDGRVTGYGHPNEGRWAPYRFGPARATEAFAFISSHNNWIPSSTWTQSVADIPIGFFCDEPELQQAAQKLCLIPQSSNVLPTDVVYLVASCLRFYERTVPILLQQLFAENISADRIKVVVNGCTENADVKVDGIDYAFSTHNAWEWSTLYEAPRRWSFDYGFLLHDTSVVLPGFRRSVECFNRYIDWDHLPASPMARCLLGIYSHNFLMREHHWLGETDNISKSDGVIAEVAGELLLRARSALILGDAEHNGGARPAEWRETVDHFNTGSPRVRRAFPAIKLHKFLHSGGAKPESL